MSQTSEWMKSACILCECNCGIEVQTQGRELLRIRGDKAHPASAGYTCEKALRLNHYQARTERLTTPLRRTADGTYEEVTWDQAIADIAAKLQQIKKDHGGQSIFFYGGGGQGNHLGATYNKALQAAVGAKFTSNALAQEKTGEMYVDGRMYGGHTKGDFEHAEVVVFVGKNPWQSHSFPRARPVLKDMAADPDRCMVVIDPRRSETAAMADIHLQVKPGTDSWCLAALCAVLMQEDLVDHEFLNAHTVDHEPVLLALGAVDVSAASEVCGIDEATLRHTARRIAAAASVCTYEDLGIQQAPNSTLNSYLNKLLWILTGNFAKRGGMFLHSTFAPIAGSAPSSRGQAGSARPSASPLQQAQRRLVRLLADGVPRAIPRLPGPLVEALAQGLAPRVAAIANGPDPRKASAQPRGEGRRTPVTGARVIAGLVPCNSIAEEILTDHPDRFRALWIDSSNPAHSLADSASFRAAMRAVELSVVIDVAMTETAREADYVLPASSQFEKYECTFFNVDFPHNVFHLRRPLLTPLEGTLPEAEIYARVIRALGVVEPSQLKLLSSAARKGRTHFATTFFALAATDPRVMGLAGYLLYETLGPTLPEEARQAASLWGVSQLCAMAYPDAVRRAGFSGAGFAAGEQLFERVLTGEAVAFTVDDYADAWNYVKRPEGKIHPHLPEFLSQLELLEADGPGLTSPEFPFVLSAGERRAFTANTIIRDPQWRRRDAQGALRISPSDAAALGLADGESVRVVTHRGQATTPIEISEMMQAGHISLPNGLGLDHDGQLTGVAPNDLTDVAHRDPWAGTPLHKHVPARLESVS